MTKMFENLRAWVVGARGGPRRSPADAMPGHQDRAPGTGALLGSLDSPVDATTWSDEGAVGRRGWYY